jgi:hypothetical protein
MGEVGHRLAFGRRRARPPRVVLCVACGAPLAPVLARLAAALCHDCRDLGESAWDQPRPEPSPQPKAS